MSREASTWRGVGEESEKRGEFLSKFFYGAHGRSSIDCFSRAFLPSLSRAAFSVCRSGRDHIFFFSLTLNIALKSTAPRRVRQEPDEPPELSATTIVFCVDKKMKEEEKQKWFFFFDLYFFYFMFAKRSYSLSLFPLLSPLSSLKTGERRASFDDLFLYQESSSEGGAAVAYLFAVAAAADATAAPPPPPPLANCALPRLDARPPAMISPGSTSSPERFLTISTSSSSSPSPDFFAFFFGGGAAAAEEPPAAAGASSSSLTSSSLSLSSSSSLSSSVSCFFVFLFLAIVVEESKKKKEVRENER